MLASSVWPYEADHSTPAILVYVHPYTHGFMFKLSEVTIFYSFIAVPLSGYEKKTVYVHSICHHTYTCSIELGQCNELL